MSESGCVKADVLFPESVMPSEEEEEEDKDAPEATLSICSRLDPGQGRDLSP